MSACEKCWADAYAFGLQYLDLLLERAGRPFTPEEQAGWNARECKACGRTTLHQITGECMARCAEVTRD